MYIEMDLFLKTCYIKKKTAIDESLKIEDQT